MPLRILHIVSYMDRGGLETFLMNCYRHIDREQIQFDFLVHRSFQADYDGEIEALGGRIYRLPRLNPLSPGYYRALFHFFRSHGEYKIVHCHLDCMNAIPLFAAKLTGIPVRIAHAHSSGQDKDWKYPVKILLKKWIPLCASHLFACSEAAGKWMFPNRDHTLIYNGVDTRCFRYDPQMRNSMRKHLSVENKLVIGHVGRFAPVKNHSFLIDVFSHFHAQHPDSVLLLIGDGQLHGRIQKQVQDLSLSDSVIFAGKQNSVSPYYQAMDLFLFPSRYEGFGISVLEAQVSGLPCVISQEISEECTATDLVTKVPLSASAQDWAAHILSRIGSSRSDHAQIIRGKGGDIRKTTNWLQQFYFDSGM